MGLGLLGFGFRLVRVWVEACRGCVSCCGLLLWSTVVVYCCGVLLWSTVVVYGCGLWLWSVVVVCCAKLSLVFSFGLGFRV